jgi:hypothetical protein
MGAGASTASTSKSAISIAGADADTDIEADGAEEEEEEEEEEGRMTLSARRNAFRISVDDVRLKAALTAAEVAAIRATAEANRALDMDLEVIVSLPR